MNVSYFDLKAQYAELREEICAALDRVCQNASFILGEEVTRFEQAFATYCEVKHCVALNSGTSALHLALLSAGIGPGDEVITTANTFIATAEAICYTGSTPVFADIDPVTANLDPALVERAITKRTKAIVPVHLYGRQIWIRFWKSANAQADCHRRRLPGPRGSRPLQASGRLRIRCGFQFLSRQEPGRIRRGRRTHYQR